MAFRVRSGKSERYARFQFFTPTNQASPVKSVDWGSKKSATVFESRLLADNAAGYVYGAADNEEPVTEAC